VRRSLTGRGRRRERDLERRQPLFERYWAGLPEFVQRRHADALDAAKAAAERGVDALDEPHPRRPVYPVPPLGGTDTSA
jgi:hypothetical protein